MRKTSARMTPISRRHFCSTRSDQGFTLIEILIVIALIAIISAIAIPSLGVGLKINIDSSTRELAGTIRETHDEAVLRGQIYRLAFNIDKGKYWAELGDRSFLMESAAQEEEDRRQEERLHHSDEEIKKNTANKGNFTLAEKVTRKQLSLPTGVSFTDVVTSRSKGPLKGGMAYGYVFPNGFVEKLIIHVKDALSREATLIVDPVSGKSKVLNRYVSEKDIREGRL